MRLILDFKLHTETQPRNSQALKVKIEEQKQKLKQNKKSSMKI